MVLNIMTFLALASEGIAGWWCCVRYDLRLLSRLGVGSSIASSGCCSYRTTHPYCPTVNLLTLPNTKQTSLVLLIILTGSPTRRITPPLETSIPFLYPCHLPSQNHIIQKKTTSCHTPFPSNIFSTTTYTL